MSRDILSRMSHYNQFFIWVRFLLNSTTIIIMALKKINIIPHHTVFLHYDLPIALMHISHTVHSGFVFYRLCQPQIKQRQIRLDWRTAWKYRSYLWNNWQTLKIKFEIWKHALIKLGALTSKFILKLLGWFSSHVLRVFRQSKLEGWAVIYQSFHFVK